MNVLTRTSTSEKLSTPFFTKKALGTFLSIVLSAALLSGCLENRKGIVLLPKLNVSPAPNSSSYAITLTNVTLEQTDPSGTFDIIGDGSGKIGTYCTAISATDTSGASTCSCVYDYQFRDPSTGVISSQEVSVDTTRHEADLVRCPFGQLPPSVSSVGVSLVTKDHASKSNSITFSFGTNSGILDTSKDYNFAKVFRYTCRKKINILNIMDTVSGIYDYYQSEDASNSYPISFYTSNIGASLNAYASGGSASGGVINDYDCPADPLHPSSEFAETIYSSVADTDGTWVMSGTPGAATVDMNAKNSRSTFYLSKMKTGIFTINVNAYIAPNIISQISTTPNPQGGGFPSLGWGASPRSTGVGVESCPADTPTTAGVTNPDYVTIPSGYHWVKVWLFRMTFSPRKYLKGANLANLGGLGCNPGKNSSNVVEFPDCAGLAALGDGSGLPPALISLGLGMCLTPTYDGSGNLTHLTPGGSDPTYSCSKQPVPWANPWSSTNTYGLDVCNGSGVATTTVPFDSAPTAEVYGNEDSAAPYEFLFVTTPPSVNSSDMSNSASPIYARYAPMRFRVDGDCGAADPSGCSTQYMLRNYGLKLHDVADAGDPPASDPSRAGVFPICALQPN